MMLDHLPGFIYIIDLMYLKSNDFCFPASYFNGFNDFFFLQPIPVDWNLARMELSALSEEKSFSANANLDLKEEPA